jgi:putative transposase
MTNHTHLIAVPETGSAMSNTMRDIHGAYASMFNRKYRITGHLWQTRFYSCVLDHEHLAHAVRYVERNPVRAGMVLRAEDYPGPAPIRSYLGTAIDIWLTGCR